MFGADFFCCLDFNGNLFLMPHAIERRLQRNISINDIIYVLTTGQHESNKDKYHEKYSEWNYSIIGETIDERHLRIIVSFDKNNMLVITVINLKRR